MASGSGSVPGRRSTGSCGGGASHGARDGGLLGVAPGAAAPAGAGCPAGAGFPVHDAGAGTRGRGGGPSVRRGQLGKGRLRAGPAAA